MRSRPRQAAEPNRRTPRASHYRSVSRPRYGSRSLRRRWRGPLRLRGSAAKTPSDLPPTNSSPSNDGRLAEVQNTELLRVRRSDLRADFSRFGVGQVSDVEHVRFRFTISVPSVSGPTVS